MAFSKQCSSSWRSPGTLFYTLVREYSSTYFSRSYNPGIKANRSRESANSTIFRRVTPWETCSLHTSHLASRRLFTSRPVHRRLPPPLRQPARLPHISHFSCASSSLFLHNGPCIAFSFYFPSYYRRFSCRSRVNVHFKRDAKEKHRTRRGCGERDERQPAPSIA